jgi:hypothetical protein
MDKIRKPAAFDRAAEKRAQREEQIVQGIARRIPAVIRTQHDYVLVANYLTNALLALAAGGAKRPEKGKKEDAERLMALALDLCVEEGTVILTRNSSGEVILEVERPEPIRSVEETWEHCIALLRPRHYRLALAWGYC